MYLKVCGKKELSIFEGKKKGQFSEKVTGLGEGGTGREWRG